jgi:hypothetical protein
MSKPIPYAIGMRYKTRGGETVKIIHHVENPNDRYVVCGILTDSTGKETLESWTADGIFNIGFNPGESPLDLLPVEVVDYEAMAKQLAIALREMAHHASIGGVAGDSSIEHANLWLAEARKAGLIP